MTRPAPFQTATVKVAYEALNRGGPKRFLIADEVGLGKTVVAQQILKKMMDEREGVVTVFYVCSNLTIASQNKRKLLEVLDFEERSLATCDVDRLTLLPAEDAPTHPKLRLFTLTPDTSIPLRKGKRRDGRQEERALVQALLEATFPHARDALGRDFFKRGAKRWWSWWLETQRKKAGESKLRDLFREAIREEFELESGDRLLTKLNELSDLDKLARFRNALAACAIREMHPDLVIFDEFQRFKDLLAKPESKSAARVISKLRGDSGEAALLLLSATPYRHFSTRWEDSAGQGHHKEFLELVEFLYGNDTRASGKRNELEAAFAVMAREIRKGALDSAEARFCRLQIEALLHPILARTERHLSRVESSHLPTTELRAPLRAEDLQVFNHWATSVKPGHKAACVPYWTSIPLPMQTMGSRYVVWDEAKAQRGVRAPEFTEADRDSYSTEVNWAHPRLRSLLEQAPTSFLGLPWIAPTMPWWNLRGPWASPAARRGKILVFSRFRAVPQAIAAALSFELEAATIGWGKIGYEAVNKRRLLQATGERYALLALFHPSPTLALLADPLAAKGDFNRALSATRSALKVFLTELGVTIQAGTERPIWQLVARLEGMAGRWPSLYQAWQAVHKANRRRDPEENSKVEGRTGGLGRIIERWDEEAQIGLEQVSPEEMAKLAHFALSAPGNIFGRALQRLWPEAMSENGFVHTLEASWNGLRTYLDQRQFLHALGGESERNYPKILQRATVQGNLEAVLDEYFWSLNRLNGLNGAELASEALSALQVHSSDTIFHGLNDRRLRFSVRSHASLPFIEAKQAYFEGETIVERPLRTDEMRKAFNSPFYPHVLATTSVGQEGLDFHTWCATIVHWDLASNPVDIEQREGRIQRYAGLSVRRVIADLLKQKVLSKPGVNSPWHTLAELAEAKLTDDSGLSPWWVLKDAKVDRFVFDVPISEQRDRLAWLKEQRLLYRLVLGQPNQEDLLEVLARKGKVDPEKVFGLLPRLSAWGREEGGVAGYPAGEFKATISQA